MINIKLKNKFSIEKDYQDISQLRLVSEDNEYKIFTRGEPATVSPADQSTKVYLTNNYQGTPLEVTENGYIDLKTNIEKDKNIPLYIDINIPFNNDFLETTGTISDTSPMDVSQYKAIQVVDQNLVSENIKFNKNILGINGTYVSADQVTQFTDIDFETIIKNTTNVNYLFTTDSRNNFDFLNEIDFSHVTNTYHMFADCSNLVVAPVIDTSNVTQISGMFKNCANLTTISQLNTSKATDLNGLFSGCKNLVSVPILDLSNAKYLSYMFKDCEKLSSIPQLDTSNVTNMASAFYGCKSLTTIPLLDTSKVTNMERMFENCSNLSSIPQLDTSNVTNFSFMFHNCTNLTSTPQLDTSKATDISYLFCSCNKLTSVKLNIPKATNYWNAFLMCYNLQYVDLSHFNSSYLGWASNWLNGTFVYCYSLKDLVLRNVTGSIDLGTSTYLNKCYHFSGTVDPVYNPNGLKDGKIYIPFSTWHSKFSRNSGYNNDHQSYNPNNTGFSSYYFPLEYYTVDGSLNGDLDLSKRDLPIYIVKLYYDEIIPNSILYSLDNGATWVDLATVTPTSVNSDVAGDGANLVVLFGVSQIKFKLVSAGERVFYINYYGGVFVKGNDIEVIESENYILTKNPSPLYIRYSTI